MISHRGKYYIVSMEREYTDLIRDRIKLKGLGESLYVINTIKQKVEVPDNSIDIAFAFFRLHEDNTDWIIRETSRILKTTGKCVVIDSLSLGGHIYELIRTEFVPNHSRMGIDMEIFSNLIAENDLDITYQREDKGVIFLILENSH
ncbi:MAG: methyltransferase domain-containing protein [Candidatus Lokiarchaeota archaeon]|nr:methyltransferase domain-containing protein [Candidatus Lokiarchaeota archaeon]